MSPAFFIETDVLRHQSATHRAQCERHTVSDESADLLKKTQTDL